MNQESLSLIGYYHKGKKTRREEFLEQMDKVVPWKRLTALIEPHYPKASISGGRPAFPIERLLRVYCLQQWYNLSDPAAEEALYDSLTMRHFAGVRNDNDVIPDESTILRFRHLLETYKLTERMFQEINVLLGERGFMVGKGTIVDATIINAPSSTKNAERKRDPEMHQTKKGQQYYFGMKVHTGVDTEAGLVHTVVCTAANLADNQVLGELLHGEEQALYGDAAYQARELKEQAEAAKIEFKVCERAGNGRPLTKKQKASNRKISKVRSIVEHPYLIVKKLWGHAKVRYRGIAKNNAQMHALFGLSNLYRVRHWLLAT